MKPNKVYFCSDRFISAMLGTAVLLMLFSMNVGITCSNDASHYYLLRSMVKDGTVTTDPYYIKMHVDAAMRGGHYYSDRAPGLAMYAAPVYAVSLLGPLFPKPILTSRLFGDPGDSGIMAFVFTLNLAAAGVAVVGFFLLRSAGVSKEGAAISALAAVFATPMLKYGTCGFSHGLSALLFVVTIALVLQTIARTGRSRIWWGLASGCALGFAVGVEYTNVVLVAVVGIVIISSGYARGWSTVVPVTLAIGAGALAGIAPTLVYHTVAFGSPFSTGYKYKIAFQDVHQSLATTFNYPLGKGLYGNWVDFADREDLNVRNVGLLPRYPILIFGLIGLYAGLRTKGVWTAGSLWLGVICSSLLMATYAHFSGNTTNSRFMTPAAVLACLGLGFLLDKVSRQFRRPWDHLALMAVYGVLAVSVANSLRALMNSHGYVSFRPQLEYYQGFEVTGSIQEWTAVFNAVFLNIGNIGYVALPLLVLWIIELFYQFRGKGHTMPVSDIKSDEQINHN